MSSTTPLIRRFDFDHDQPFVERILLEVGWRSPGDTNERNETRARFHAAADAFVAELRGEPECFVTTVPGSVRYHGVDLPFAGVTGVVTGRVGRKQGLASRTTARALAWCGGQGATVAGLGIFDQGFYDKLGFGTGGYEHFATIDPASLEVPYCTRAPVRLGWKDASIMHAGRLARRRGHGSVSLHPEETTLMSTTNVPTAFGLGFRDETGALTHHLWIDTERAGTGPYRVLWASYTTVAQYVELLGLLRNLGDQVYLVWLIEPPGLQIQDFLHRPFRRSEQAKRGEYETTNRATAAFQYRLLDVERGLRATAARRTLPAFRMRVSDPVTRYLHDHDGWQGVAGDYEVSPAGAVRTADDSRRADLEISVGDLTRAWLGVVPLTTLREIRPVTVSPGLARELDEAFGGDLPRTDWLY